MARSVEDYVNYDTIEDAVAAAAADAPQPIAWNPFQQLMSALLSSYPDASKDRKYWAALRKSVMDEVHGEGWAARAPNPLREKALATVREEAAQPEAGSSGDLGAGEEAAQLAATGTAGADSSAGGADVDTAAATANGAVAEELLGAHLANALEDYAGRDSETSSQCDGRVALMCQTLEERGATDAAIVQGAKIEYYMRDLSKRYAAEQTDGLATPPF